MNKAAHTQKTCVQDAVGTTGTGFATTKGVIAMQRPRLVILENVPTLQERPDPESMSDAEYIVAELQALGYWSKWFRFDAREFGSLPCRERIYLVGVLNLPQSAMQEAESLAHEVFCAAKRGALDSSEFVCHDRIRLVSARNELRFAGMKAKQKNSDNASFRDEHFELFKFARFMELLKFPAHTSK
jgi:site-specific DNA-cytosine methylase